MKPIDNVNRRSPDVPVAQLPPDARSPSAEPGRSGLRLLYQRIQAGLESLRDRISFFFGFSSPGRSGAPQPAQDDCFPPVSHVKSASTLLQPLHSPHPHRSLRLPRGRPVEQVRALLSEPEYARQLAGRQSELKKKGLQNHIDFLSNLRTFGKGGASDPSTKLKDARTLLGEGFTFGPSSASLSRIESLIATLPGHIHENYDDAIDDVLSLIRLDTPVGKSGLAALLKDIEQSVSEDFLRKLSEHEDSVAVTAPAQSEVLPARLPSANIGPLRTIDLSTLSPDRKPADVSQAYAALIEMAESAAEEEALPPIQQLDFVRPERLFDNHPADSSTLQKSAPSPARLIEHVFLLLSGPEFDSLRAALTEKLGQKQITAITNSLIDLQALRRQPTVEAADQLKDYVVSGAGDLLNLGPERISQFNILYEAARQDTHAGKSIGDARLLDVFDPIEAFVARQILNARE